MKYITHTLKIEKKEEMDFEASFSLLQPVYFTLLLLPIFITLVYKWSFTTTPTLNPPPSPPKLPIIGHLHQLGLYLHRSLQALSQRHGPLILLHFGSVPVVVVSSAEGAREIMKTQDLIFSDRPQNTLFKKLIYNRNDIATAPYGEYWRQVKSICVLNLVNNKRVRSFGAVREEETKAMLDKIKQSSSTSSVVNLTEVFMTLTNNVICRAALGRKYSGEGGREFKELFEEFIELMGALIIGDYIPWLSWFTYVNGMNARIDKLAKRFDDFLDNVVQEHMDSKIEKEDDQKDFVDVLLDIQKQNSLGIPLNRVSIKAIILDVFAGGTDTTHTVLDWAMAELMKNPRVMNKLQKEIRGVVGNREGLITEDDLVKMPYLKLVMKEALRLHPPFTLLLPHNSTQNVNVNGYDIKGNTQVIVNAWAIGRDPKSYNKPDEFEPERFLNCDIDYKGNDFELIPFGAGRRRCPAIQFAMAVNELALANVLYKFNWALPDGATAEDLDMTESVGIATHRKLRLKAVATPFSF